jgi:hypothetical protein
MEKIYTIVDQTGKELYAVKYISNLNENEIAIEELRTEQMDNPYFDFNTRTFYNKINK